MNPHHSFIKSIANSSHTSDLVDKLGEVGLDSFLQAGTLKEIPIIGTAISLYKAGNDIAAYFFAKKILTFLSETEAIPLERRRKFVEEQCSEEEGIEHVGEVTLMLLEKVDHPSLARLLGRAFRLMVEGVISRPSFELYSYVIKNLNSYLLRQMSQFYQHENVMLIDAPAAVQLSNYGLVDIHVLPRYSGSTKTMPKSYERTDFGAQFYARIVKDD